jgi:hypothetical protein
VRMNFRYDLSLIMRLEKQSSIVITSRYPDGRVGSEAVVIGEHAEMSDLELPRNDSMSCALQSTRIDVAMACIICVC